MILILGWIPPGGALRQGFKVKQGFKDAIPGSTSGGGEREKKKGQKPTQDVLWGAGRSPHTAPWRFTEHASGSSRQPQVEDCEWSINSFHLPVPPVHSDPPESPSTNIPRCVLQTPPGRRGQELSEHRDTDRAPAALHTTALLLFPDRRLLRLQTGTCDQTHTCRKW